MNGWYNMTTFVWKGYLTVMSICYHLTVEIDIFDRYWQFYTYPLDKTERKRYQREIINEMTTP